ncbi:MAG: ADP-ribosylglycohydrolase family protein, partial [Bacteroidota bacterium]
MRISWLEIPERITHELQQRAEEGNDVSSLREEWNTISHGRSNDDGFRGEAEKFYQKLESTSSLVKNAVHEPSDWNSIAKECRIVVGAVQPFSSAFIEDRIAGGWLGRSAGCLLGKPVEKHPRAGIIELLSSNGSWPINDYITANGIPETLLKKYPWNRHYGKESLKENIVCMPEDDDMNY